MAKSFKAPVIRYDEILFVLYEDGEHQGFDGPIATWDGVLAYVNGTSGVKAIRRYEGFHGEDITEETAQAFIEQNIDDLTGDSAVDLYVRNSNAWTDFLSAEAASSATDARYGTYEQQNRISYRDVS